MGALAYSVTTGGLVPECGFYEECDDRVRAPVKPASRFSRRWPVGSAGAHQGGREAGPGVRQRRPSIAGLSRQGIYAQLGQWPPGLPGGAGGGTSHAVTQRRAKPADSLQRGLLMNPPWTPKTLHGALWLPPLLWPRHSAPSHSFTSAAEAEPRSCCLWHFQSPAGGGRWGCGGVALPPEVGDSRSTGRRPRQRQLRTGTDAFLHRGPRLHLLCAQTPHNAPHTASQERFR